MMPRSLLGWCAAILASATVVFTVPAQAQNVDATLNKVETFLGYTDKAAPGQLPVSQAEFKQYRAVFKACVASNDADDAILCADAFLDTPAGKEVAEELPSWTPMALDIYMDIRNDDFWGLARDVGMAAACIGAQVIAGGIDVCGVIQALVDMAKEAYASALAAYKFFSDLGSTVAAVSEKVYCLFADCSDSGPPPEAVAWANFWHPRIPTGANLMKSSGDPAALEALSFNFINGEGLVLKVQNPNVYAALAGTRGQYIDAVKLQWDAQILQQVIPSVAKVRQAFLQPDKAQSQVKSGLNAALPASISEPWQMASWRKQANTNVGYFCRMAMFDAHAAHVSRWVKDGRAAKLGSSEKGATPEQLCEPHLQLAQPLFDNGHRLATRDLLLAKGCTSAGNTYICDSVQMDTTCDFAVDYFKSGFACQIDWRKAVAKLMGNVYGCKLTSGDQIYECNTWLGQDSCEVHFAKVNQISAPHCKLDRAAADADLAKQQIATLSTPTNACTWQSGQPTGQIICPRDVQHLNCQALQTKPLHPIPQVHALGCKLQRTPAYEAAVQQANALRSAMAGAGMLTRSNTLNAPAIQIVGAQQGSSNISTVQWQPHPDPLLFMTNLSTVSTQGLSQIDQLAKSKQPSFAGFAKCAILGAGNMLIDKDGVDAATLCTQGQIADGQKQLDELGKKLGGLQATVAPGLVMPGGGGPVQVGNAAGNPAVGVQLQGVGGVGAGLPALSPMSGGAPTQQVMSAPMPAGTPGASHTSGQIATPVRSAAQPVAAVRSVTPDAPTLRSLIAAGCRQPNAATPGVITCGSEAALAQCVAVQREGKVGSCSLQR